MVPNGHRRHIPGIDAYNRLFKDWHGIATDLNATCPINDGPLANPGGQVPHAYLAKGSGQEVYLMVDNRKHWIVTDVVFNRYQFGWSKIVAVSDFLLNTTPTGDPWT